MGLSHDHYYSRSQKSDQAAHDEEPEDDLDLELEEPEERLEPTAEELRPDVDALWQKHYEEQTDDLRRFSLIDLLFVTTVAAVTFAIVRIFPLPIGTAIIGFTVLLGIFVMGSAREVPRPLKLAWWSLLISYLVLVLVTTITA